ncbi:MAG TPA: lipopolysaccharide assembly protein LapA domain-containing protein [Pseudonocardiaceae bacterium]|nr:lipopolysaccharide assembly protein LapA domain-containing protein [Pseudonocardiaceae bacterium]
MDVPQTRPSPASVRHTRISGTWVAIIVAVIVLVFLLIFILQNLANATVSFLGAGGTLPLGVAMLLAAVAGALLVSLVGTARILQLRRHTGKQRRTIASKKAKQH